MRCSDSVVRLHIDHTTHLSQFLDPARPERVLFCPLEELPPSGSRLQVEVSFASGPTFLLCGNVVWRRPVADLRVAAGVGVEVDPRFVPALRFMSQWSRGEASERRRHIRYPLRLRVVYGGPVGKRVNFTRDMSASGLFVRSLRPVPVGERVFLVLSWPERRGTLELEGEVVRLEPDAGMGVELAFSSRTQRESYARRLDSLVQRFRRGTLPLRCTTSS